MPDKPQRKVRLYAPPPRREARLDHWVGHHQHVADGVSTDPCPVPPKGGRTESQPSKKTRYFDGD